MKKYSAFLLCLIITCYQVSFAQSTTPSFVQDSLNSYVEKALREWKMPGVAIAIVKDGQVILRAYGVRELGKNDKVDENTLFMIGSNTKAMTATVLAMLQDQKKLSLDDKVVKWLPDFKLKDPWVTKELNIRDLLCHRIGMETFQGDFMYWTSSLSDKQVVEKFGKLTPMYSFRSKWGYTNAAFVVGGQVITAVAGKSWSDYLTENIFKPLGMDRTVALSKDLTNATNKATAHTFDHNQELVAIPFCDIDNLAPAGSVSSSASDMSKWVLALLNNGKVADKTVIPSNAINQTKLPHSILGNGGHPFNKNNFTLYGLGWMLQDYNGKRLISHTGGVNGFVTSVTLMPEEKLGIVVLTNTDQNSFYEAVKWEILDAYLKLPYRNYSDAYATNNKAQLNSEKSTWKKKSDTVALHNATALPLNAFAGQYQNDVYGWLKIAANNDHLVMTFQHHPKLQGKMEPLGGNRFLCTYNDPVFGKKVLSFSLADNKVKSLTLRVADFVEFTTYEFIKN